MRVRYGLVVLVLCAALAARPARAAVTENSFLLHSTGDLVDLCSAPQSDPLYTAATNFCHGFVLGVFQVLQEEDMARRSRHLFCLPNPPPPRNEAIANFVQWAKADPSHLAQPPADAVAAFLTQQYPCPRGR